MMTREMSMLLDDPVGKAFSSAMVCHGIRWWTLYCTHEDPAAGVPSIDHCNTSLIGEH
jgi:hypothetical protein